MAADEVTKVVLTGTGIPHPTPGRAGPGALVRHGDVALQFDAGRGTVMRLAEAKCSPAHLSAMFLTHIHSDHLCDLADVAMTRWVQQQLHSTGPLTVVATAGDAARFVEAMFDVWEQDIRLRMDHTGAGRPELDLVSFEPAETPREVWRSDDGQVRVEAVLVHHEPVHDAVAYRVVTPRGRIVISGDTRVCAEVESLSQGADVLVHEACRATALEESVRGSVFEKIFTYHADTVALGALAAGADVGHLVLTHLIPSPRDDREEAAFVEDIRRGGFSGTVTVGRDLMSFEV